MRPLPHRGTWPGKLQSRKNKRTFAGGQFRKNDMLRAGRTQKLTVSRVSEYGLYLTDEEQNEVLLPTVISPSPTNPAT